MSVGEVLREGMAKHRRDSAQRAIANYRKTHSEAMRLIRALIVSANFLESTQHDEELWGASRRTIQNLKRDRALVVEQIKHYKETVKFAQHSISYYQSLLESDR